MSVARKAGHAHDGGGAGYGLMHEGVKLLWSVRLIILPGAHLGTRDKYKGLIETAAGVLRGGDYRLPGTIECLSLQLEAIEFLQRCRWVGSG